LRVGVDARHLTGGRGIAHYTSALLHALAERFPEDEWVAYVPRGKGPEGGAATASGAAAASAGEAGSGRQAAAGRRAAAKRPAAGAAAASGAAAAGGGGTAAASGAGVEFVRGSLPSRVVFGAAAVAGRPTLDALLGKPVDVLWIPAPAPVAIGRRTPYVLSVHDLSWLERPGDFTRYERLWHRLARPEQLASEAAAVVAVSEATRRAINRRWPRVRSIDVVHSGIPPLPPPAPAPPRPRPYVLAVGALEPRKAPHALKEAHARARAQGLEADLVFAGRGRLAPTLRAEGVEVVEDPGSQTLSTLYAHALALALPSHLEGFGFTALEAARAGTPVLAASHLPTVELLGEKAILPVTGDWAQALLTIERDDELRTRLSEAGREAATRFDWSTAADELHQILERAAATPR
jgi:glycosyltransferase involved in cell wall biosynthesis